MESTSLIKAGGLFREGFDSAMLYTQKQYKKIFPYFLICVFTYYGIWVLTSGSDLQDIFSRVYEMPIDLLLLQAVGIDTGNVGITWYLSVYFISLPIALVFFSTCKPSARKYFFFVLPFFGYSFIIAKSGTVANTFGLLSLIRGFSGIMLGFLAFEFIDKVPNKLFATITGVFVFLISFLHTTRSEFADKSFDICFVILAAILVWLFGGINTNIACKPIKHLSNLALPIYLFHIPVLKVMMIFGVFGEKINTKLELAVYILTVLIFCELLYIFIEKLIRQRFKKIYV